MISKDFIKKEAVRGQTLEENIAREYIQHLFLSNFYNLKNSEKVLFKGGTALRIIYGSPRFSEDLDFTGYKISINSIENLIINSLSKIAEIGIRGEIKESKKTSGGYLGIMEFPFLEFNVRIQIEISLRKKNRIDSEIITIVNNLIPSYNLTSLSSKEIVEEKTKALLERSKPRDWYDFYFILRANLGGAIAKKYLRNILDKLKENNLDMKRELKNLLPSSHHQILKDFKGNVEREIRKFL